MSFNRGSNFFAWRLSFRLMFQQPYRCKMYLHYAQRWRHDRAPSSDSYDLNDYAPHEQARAIRQTMQRRQLNASMTRKIGGDPEFAHIRKRIDKVKFVGELEYILENPENHSTCVFNRAMQKATQMHKYHYAKKIFDEMYSGRHTREYIDPVSFSSLFLALSAMKPRPIIIHEYIKKMYGLDVHPDSIVLTSVVRCLRKTDTLRSILRVWKKFTEKYQVIPDIPANIQLLAVYGKFNQIKEAEHLWLQMVKKQNAMNNGIAASAMLDVYASNGLTEKMLNFFKLMVDATLPIGIPVVDSMMRCYVHAKQPFRAVDIDDLIDTEFTPKYGIQKDEFVIQTLTYTYLQIIKHNLGDKGKYLEKLRTEIPQEREKIALSPFSADLMLSTVEGLFYTYSNPKEWSSKIVPEFRSSLEKYELKQYLGRIDEDGNILVDVRKLKCGVFVVWYVFNCCQEVVTSAKGNYIICITGKYTQEGDGDAAKSLMEDLTKCFAGIVTHKYVEGRVHIPKHQQHVLRS